MVTLIPIQVPACLRARGAAREPSEAKKAAAAAAAKARAKAKAATYTNPTDRPPRGQAYPYRFRALHYP